VGLAVRNLIGRALNGLAAALLYLVLGFSALVLAVLAGVMLPFFAAGLVLHVAGRVFLGLPWGPGLSELVKLEREKLGEGY